MMPGTGRAPITISSSGQSEGNAERSVKAWADKFVRWGEGTFSHPVDV